MAKLPDRLGPLKLETQIGVGRHCQIWEAVDTGSRGRVAVKLIVPEKARDAGVNIGFNYHRLKCSTGMTESDAIVFDFKRSTNFAENIQKGSHLQLTCTANHDFTTGS